MTSDRPADYLVSLLRELCALPVETEWVDFMVDHTEPQAIGESILALANSAALVGKAFAYPIRSVRDDDAVVGTFFDHHAALDAVEAGAIVPADPDDAPQLMRYLPLWAAALSEGRR